MLPPLRSGLIAPLALAAGLRFANHSHFLTTSPFGAMERYLPSGPSLF